MPRRTPAETARRAARQSCIHTRGSLASLVLHEAPETTWAFRALQVGGGLKIVQALYRAEVLTADRAILLQGAGLKAAFVVARPFQRDGLGLRVRYVSNVRRYSRCVDALHDITIIRHPDVLGWRNVAQPRD